MPELTVTTAEGETLVLSQLLQQKKMVVLNFWYADCIWCIRECPVMEVSYQKYKQDVEILALDPYDAPQDIETFQREYSLSFPMASCSRDLTMAFGINGYPTSVVIDREGTICMIHPGAITDVRVFDQLFETFTAEDYTPQLYSSISDLF
jgi:peroxiredoxin